MILFLYGEDTYRSRRKLDEIRAKFSREIDPSGMNLNVIDGETASAADFRTAATSLPFLAKKRLVVLKNAMRDGDAELGKALVELTAAGVPEEIILAVYEGAGGEALDGHPAFAKLKSGRFYPEFTPMSPKELAAWILQETGARGARFSDDAHALYCQAAGNDAWKVSSELDALSAHAASRGGIIDSEAVRSLARVRLEENIFDLLDAVGTARPDEASRLIDRLLAQGESEVGLLNRLQGHVRTLLLCADLAGRARVSKEVVAREIGIHPFVAAKALTQARRFDQARLRDLYLWLIEADKKLKLGGWPQPRMALDLFLLELAS
jgi:DNA polymerase-3 subunit delta